MNANSLNTTKKVKHKPKRTALTQDEVNQLLSFLCNASHNAQVHMVRAKQLRTKVWAACDKDRKDDPKVAK